MPRIRINTNGLKSNISAMQNHIRQLEILNGSLTTLISNIDASWEGEACKSYISTMQKRLAKSQQMVKVLTTFKKYMEDALSRFEERDKSGWRRINYTAGGGGYSYGGGGGGSSGGGGSMGGR